MRFPEYAKKAASLRVTITERIEKMQEKVEEMETDISRLEDAVSTLEQLEFDLDEE
jgi:predicted  nucleic acid-binding Zn-ribbon protein